MAFRTNRVSLATLRRLFAYNASTGVFRWRVARLAGKGMARVQAGDVAGKTDKAGYRVLTVGGVRLRAHRVAWAMHYGRFPRRRVNHRNGTFDDNRIANLRLATQSEACCTRRTPSSNTSGFRGVSFHRASQRWVAYIKKHGRRRHLGLFDTAENASAAYKSAAKKLHGQFANVA